MTPDQVLALLTVIANLQRHIDALIQENAELRASIKTPEGNPS